MKNTMLKSILLFGSLLVIGSQTQAKVSTPEQYMSERTKISNKTNSIRDRIEVVTKNPTSVSPRDLRIMCNDAPKAINELTQLNLDAMKMFPAEAQKVLKDENQRNSQFVKKLNNDCITMKKQLKVQ